MPVNKEFKFKITRRTRNGNRHKPLGVLIVTMQDDTRLEKMREIAESVRNSIQSQLENKEPMITLFGVNLKDVKFFRLC